MSVWDSQAATSAAVALWRRELGSVSPDLATWLQERCEDVHILWGDIRRLVRSRNMWRDLTEVLEARDPTNAWTRDYDDLYFEAQILRLTRVFRGQVSLLTFLKDFEGQPRLCGRLTTPGLPDDLREAIDPAADRNALGRQLAPLDAWRNKRIAHIDRERDLADVRQHELGPMVDAVAGVFGRYTWRITGMDYQLAFPTSSRWKNVFTQPIFDS